MWLKKGLIIAIVLVVISPLFGVVLAETVNYHEPLDVVAEMLNLKDSTRELNWTPLLDYSVPGLPDELGYVVAGFIGVGIIVCIGFLLVRILSIFSGG